MPEKKTEKAEKAFEIRSYHPGDEKAICALFERVFGKPMGETESLQHWQWEFLENPLKELFIKLAWDKERLVGQYTASPVRIYAGGHTITAALSHDTMTDPQYGGLGIFRDTAEALYNEQKKAGHVFIYGFPNRNSIHGFTKNLQWRRIMPVPVHIRPVHLIKYFFQKITGKQFSSLCKKEDSFCDAIALSPDTSGAYTLRIEPEFGDWADDLWQRCQNQHRVWVIRDKTYLNWRYVTRPESNYTIISVRQGTVSVGYAVLNLVTKKFGSTLFVLDFMVDLNYPDAADLLIQYIIKTAKKSGVVFASVLLTPGAQYRPFFRRHLFLPLPERFFPQPLYFGARCFEPSLNNLVNDSKAWSISWGDNDVL